MRYIEGEGIQGAYRRATGFEALVGYLYLKKEYKRLVELVTIGLESMEKELENGEKND